MYLRTIIEDSHGCVKPGEMLLVLGRPGAGCTTLLKMLANRRLGYAEVTGDVKWGTLDPKQAEHFRGQIVMNTEEELFFPALTVGQTIDFATRMKVSSSCRSVDPKRWLARSVSLIDDTRPFTDHAPGPVQLVSW
jgi:ABC-type multidrug transport system ATPase subunit